MSPYAYPKAFSLVLARVLNSRKAIPTESSRLQQVSTRCASSKVVELRPFASAYKGVGIERFFQFWMAAVLALGLWMTWLAFAA